MIITVDGFSCQGKSTVARTLAEELGWEFFSIGTLFRYLADRFLQNQHTSLCEHDAVRDAIDMMHRSDMAVILAFRNAKFQELEKALSIISGYPEVHENIAARVLAYAKDKNLLIDGRVGFLLFPNALRNYYFVTSLKKRAENASRSRSLSIEDARKYIAFRDTFEIRYEIPSRVVTLSLDPFPTVDAIVRHLKDDILTLLKP